MPFIPDGPVDPSAESPGFDLELALRALTLSAVLCAAIVSLALATSAPAVPIAACAATASR